MREAAAKASSLETRIAGAEFLHVRSFLTHTHGITILVITEKEMLAFSLNYSRTTLYLQVLNLQTGAEFGDMTQILRNLGSCPPRLEFGVIYKFSSRGNDAIHE